MYPTYRNADGTVTFSDLMKDENVAQDLVIFFENGEILRASDGDIVADTFSLTEYYTTEEDIVWGDAPTPTMSVEVLTEVFDAKNPTGWARAYIGAEVDCYDSDNGFGDMVFPELIYHAYLILPSHENGQYGIYTPIGKTVALKHLTTPGLEFYLNPLTGTTTTAGTVNATITRIVTDARDGDFLIYYTTGGSYYRSTWRYDFDNDTFTSTGVGVSTTKSEALRPSITYNAYESRLVQMVMPGYAVCPLGRFEISPDDIMSGNTIRLDGNADAVFGASAVSFIQTPRTYPYKSAWFLNQMGGQLLTEAGITDDSEDYPYCGAPSANAATILQAPDVTTDIDYREALKYLAALTETNITMNRDGILAFINPYNGVADSIDGTRVEASSYSISRRLSNAITGLIAYDADGVSTLYGTDGVNYELPYNPFLAGRDATYYNAYVTDLQNDFDGNFPQYHPQSVKIITADPSVEAGDLVTVDYGGSLGTFTFPVMAQTITFPGRCQAEYSCTASINRNARTSADYSAKNAQQTADEALALAQSVGSGKVPFNGEEDTDLDNASAAGFYDYLSSAANKPTTGGGALITIDGPSPYVMQFALPRDTNGDSTAYVRQYTSSNVWGSWEKLLVASDLPVWEDITSTALTVSDTTKATIGDLKLYKCGNMRVLLGAITAVNLPTTQTTVATISSGNRPTKATAAAWAWDAARYNTYVVIGTTGTIAVRSNTAYTSGNLRVNATWIVS